ncbi:MAG TPA: pyruvate kinase [Candidatus Nanoarchaeia archaeon]|nr:pyruvate kinase [Candidatus Nanoarchaeia archaeon]
MVNAIVTIPPYATFIKEVAKHPLVSGLRLNTVMPVKESLENLLDRLGGIAGKYGKELWIDLKCRQLRVKSYGVPPFTEIKLTHKIKVDTPTLAYFHNGDEIAKVLEVDGDRLIMENGPKRVVGPGESVNIPDLSLEVDGFFTETDQKYIEAGVKRGGHNYMLSYVEGKKDVDELLKYDAKARVIAKIESTRGLEYVNHEWKNEARLMAARGDLFIEVGKPHQIVKALEDIISKDEHAIAASRIFPSFAESLSPSCSDIGDTDNLLRMGYRTFMFGDDICMHRDSIISGLNLLSAMAEKYEK